jgi:hypothetical protein
MTPNEKRDTKKAFLEYAETNEALSVEVVKAALWLFDQVGNLPRPLVLAFLVERDDALGYEIPNAAPHLRHSLSGPQFTTGRKHKGIDCEINAFSNEHLISYENENLQFGVSGLVIAPRGTTNISGEPSLTTKSWSSMLAGAEFITVNDGILAEIERIQLPQGFRAPKLGAHQRGQSAFPAFGLRLAGT